MESNSQYLRTGNHAIDLVAEAVGHARRFGKPIESITLSKVKYGLFWAGTEILRQEPLPDQHLLTFEGIPILRDESGSFESMTIKYKKIAPQPFSIIKGEA